MRHILTMFATSVAHLVTLIVLMSAPAIAGCSQGYGTSCKEISNAAKQEQLSTMQVWKPKITGANCRKWSRESDELGRLLRTRLSNCKGDVACIEECGRMKAIDEAKYMPLEQMCHEAGY